MTPQSKKSPDPLAPPPVPPPPFLSADDLRAATSVRHVEIHDTLDSTNNRAAELARDRNIALPALVAARVQTAGRGRGTNKWWAADGALTFSLLIDPAAHGLTTANWPQLSLTTAVAVCDALGARSTEHGARSENDHSAPCSLLPAPCSIKWPNDVLIAGRKICGILIESPSGDAPASQRVIVGVGMNVNNSWRAAPHEAGAEGVALCDLTGEHGNLQALLVAILQSLEIRVDQLNSGAAELARDWQSLDLLADQDVRVEVGGWQIDGVCQGISSDGALIIDTLLDRRRIYSGTVRLA